MSCFICIKCNEIILSSHHRCQHQDHPHHVQIEPAGTGWGRSDLGGRAELDYTSNKPPKYSKG